MVQYSYIHTCDIHEHQLKIMVPTNPSQKKQLCELIGLQIERANVVRWEGKEASRLQALVYNIPAMLVSHTGCYPSLIVLKKQIIEVNSIKLICQTQAKA